MINSPAFQELKKLWSNGLRGEVWKAAMAFLILIGISLGVFLALPELREKGLDQVISLFSGKDLLTEEGSISFLALFTNNLQACIFVMLYGFLPFLRLPALAMGINAALLGLLAADSVANGTVFLFLVGILPHGIVELPCLVLAFGMGLHVCEQMTRRCKGDKTALSLVDGLVCTSHFLFLVLLPLLFLAAMLEAWVTPALLLLFQSF